MKIDKYKVVDELYEKYGFIEKKKYRFSKIVFESIDEAKTYEEAVLIGKRNVMNNIIYRISNKLFPRLFYKTVKQMGIEKTFDFYNTFLEATGMTLTPYDLIKISQKEEYSPFFEKAKPNGNKLLDDVMDMYNAETEVYIDPNLCLTSGDKAYLNSINKFELLETREKEVELIQKYRETQDTEYKDEFINSNIRLVVSLAFKRRAAEHNLNLELQDLIQAGNIGLLKAFDKFDETKGFKFCTFAIWWVKSEMDKLINRENETIKIPDEIGQRLNKLRKFRDEYKNKYNIEASKEEQIAYMKMSEEEYDKLVEIEETKRILSYDISVIDSNEDDELCNNINITDFIVEKEESEYLDDEETKIIESLNEDYDDDRIITNIINLIADVENPSVEDEAIDDYFRDEMLEYARNYLKPKEYKVILELYGFNPENEAKTNTKIAEELNITHERVRQIEVFAIHRLQTNAKNINNGVSVEQEYFSKKELKKIFEEKEINNIKIVDYCIHHKLNKFKCIDCENEFRTTAQEIIQTPECPYCSETNKQLIKK